MIIIKLMGSKVGLQLVKVKWQNLKSPLLEIIHKWIKIKLLIQQLVLDTIKFLRININ